MYHNPRSRAKRTVEPILDDMGEDESTGAAASSEGEEQPVESVLSEIAKDEIDEVSLLLCAEGFYCEAVLNLT